MSGTPPSPPPMLSGQRRRSNQVGRSHSPDDVDDEEVDHFQLHQDLDAARQMSRARANSASLRRQSQGGANVHGSPQIIPGSEGSGRRINTNLNTDSLSPNAAASQTPGNSNSNYFGMSPSNPINSGSAQQGSGGLSASHSPTSPQNAYGSSAHQHPSARFYMLQNNRHGSNSSLDSASHFIDHRSQQLPPPTLSPSIRASAGSARRSQQRMDPVSTDVNSQRRRVSNAANTSALDDESSGAAINDIRSSFATQGRGSVGRTPNAASRGARSGGRLVDLGDEDEEEHEGGADTDENNHLMSVTAGTPNTMSRRNSLLQDDVCFPMLNPAEPNLSTDDDGIHRGDGHYEEQDHPHHHSHEDHRHESLPPGFPWTFDLNALEEYARAEKIRVEEEATAAATAASNWGMRDRGTSTGAARDIKRRNLNDRRSMPGSYGMSPDSDDATFYSRRPRKFINVPGLGGEDEEGKNNRSNSRYQRKLALFEGAGSSPPPIGARASTHAGNIGGILGGGALMEQERERQRLQAAQTPNGYPADTKTPLLDSGKGPGLPSYQGTNWKEPELNRSLSVGADLSNLIKNKKSSRPGKGPRSGSYNTERQYRFTFYSNALANTIHARHLYEIPAPGQSFEELFMGLDAGGYKKDDNSGGNTPSADQVPSNNASQEKLSEKVRPFSGLTNALNAGRVESNTAPPTGSNTPEMVAPGTATALRNQMRSNTATSAATANRPSNPGGAGPNIQASQAAIEKARAMPGGGIRMDQDPESCTWWLDVLCPTDQEMKMLSRVFGIHPLTTEDILMEETREKIELFRNYYLVCFRSFDQDPYSPTYLEPLNMYVIVFREGTLSFHFRATPHPQNVRRRIKQLKDYINVTSDWISYALIDDITDAFGPLIQSIEYEVDSIDELVLILKEAEQSDMLRRIGTCRKKVMGLLRLMGNKADVVKGLAKRCNENWSVAPKSDIGLYLSDIQDHLITMTQNLNHYEKILSRSHSNYLAQISIEMTDANNQINDVLSKLTALGTVIVPLNVITGLWGMNVNVPGQGVENLDWFFGIVAIMIALAVGGYFATIRYLSR
ncbi:hypothetical protein CBS101457_005334 [Exobasidium rhododendri]|nr:hypothetical protein CBS101457_005334 [Exobasidium rhododendri]